MKPRNAAALASVIGQLAGLYAWKIRPWMLQWGATPEEQIRALPGDEVIENPTHVTTHAIRINARPEDIWPWLVQMGQNRAGFYTHNWVEKLLLSRIPDVDEIHPEWQDLEVGDIMRTNREIQTGHPIGWQVAVVIPNRAVVVRSKSLPVGTYAYVLASVDGETTRLISRDRAIWQWWETPFRLLIFEPLHTYMQTGVLRGIKQRADGMSHAQPAV